MDDIKVIAKQMGYYGNQIRPEGSVFEIAAKDLIKDNSGKIVSPKWVEVAEAVVVEKYVAKEPVANKKTKDAVI